MIIQNLPFVAEKPPLLLFEWSIFCL